MSFCYGRPTTSPKLVETRIESCYLPNMHPRQTICQGNSIVSIVRTLRLSLPRYFCLFSGIRTACRSVVHLASFVDDLPEIIDCEWGHRKISWSTVFLWCTIMQSVTSSHKWPRRVVTTFFGALWRRLITMTRRPTQYMPSAVKLVKYLVESSAGRLWRKLFHLDRFSCPPITQIYIKVPFAVLLRRGALYSLVLLSVSLVVRSL